MDLRPTRASWRRAAGNLAAAAENPDRATADSSAAVAPDPRIPTDFPRTGRWHRVCLRPAVMRLRYRDRGVALTMMAFMTAATLALSAPTRHEACASTEHHCAKPAETLTCCCGHDINSSTLRGILVDRLGTSAKSVAASVPPHVGACASRLLPAPAGVPTAPLRDRPPDLPTLFSDLRL